MSKRHRLDNQQDQQALEAAVGDLEDATLAELLTCYVGAPIEYGLSRLPKNATDVIGWAAEKGLTGCAGVACATMHTKALGKSPSRTLHKAAAALTGAGCGFFGAAGVTVDIPITTSLIFRSIGDMARSQGFSPALPTTRTEMLQVFAMGGRSDAKGAGSAYYSTRNVLGAAAAKAASDWAEAIAEAALRAGGKQAAERASRIVIPKAVEKLIEKLVQRYGVQLVQKVAAMAAPVLGAGMGAGVNTVFMGHYQRRANGHFTVLRLEQKYGREIVQVAYENVRFS